VNIPLAKASVKPVDSFNVAYGGCCGINVNNLRYRSWMQLLERAHLPSGTRIHDLRHSVATLLLSKGMPIKVVSEKLGHSDVSITLSIYAHVLPEMQDGADEAMDDALS
jgi:integrase